MRGRVAPAAASRTRKRDLDRRDLAEMQIGRQGRYLLVGRDRRGRRHSASSPWRDEVAAGAAGLAAFRRGNAGRARHAWSMRSRATSAGHVGEVERAGSSSRSAGTAGAARCERAAGNRRAGAGFSGGWCGRRSRALSETRLDRNDDVAFDLRSRGSRLRRRHVPRQRFWWRR